MVGFFTALWGSASIPLTGMAIVVLLEALSPKLGRRGAYVRGLQFQVTFIFTAILLARPFELMLLKLNVPLLPPLEQWAGWMAFPIAFIVLDFLPIGNTGLNTASSGRCIRCITQSTIFML